MAKYCFLNKAVEDLSAIWDYTFKTWSEKQADKYYEMLINFCREIADNPSLGKTYEEVTKNLFGCKAGKHIIFYKIIAEDEIEIVRILHERMDLKNRIRE